MTLPSDSEYLFREIKLTQGQVAIVDAENYEEFSRHKWCARWNEKTRSFYAVRKSPRVNGKQATIWMHREVLGLKQGDPRKGDHRFHNTLDNRLRVDGEINLRIATAGQNSMNSNRHRDNRSGFKGVSFHKGSGKWQARIRKHGTQIFLGAYETPETAYAAYCDAANIHHGEFARLQ